MTEESRDVVEDDLPTDRKKRAAKPKKSAAQKPAATKKPAAVKKPADPAERKRKLAVISLEEEEGDHQSFTMEMGNGACR
jgi:hypothetical protein